MALKTYLSLQYITDHNADKNDVYIKVILIWVVEGCEGQNHFSCFKSSFGLSMFWDTFG